MDLLSEYREKHEEALKLLYGQSETDSAKDKARSILQELVELCRRGTKEEDLWKANFFKTSLPAMLLHLGVSCMGTKEFTKAEEYFSDCLKLVGDNCDLLLVSIQVRNAMGLLCSERWELLKAKEWFKEAEALYNDCDHETILDFILNENDDKRTAKEKLEYLHTMTKYSLAQVYAFLNDIPKFVFYSHETLKRQLLSNEDPVEWALGSCSLSQVFRERGLFKEARHYMAAASCVLDKYAETLEKEKPSEEEIETKREKFQETSAEVSLCWTNYGLELLKYSNIKRSGTDVEEEEESDDLKGFRFENLDVSFYENQIADSEVTSFEDARQVFLVAQRHLNKAKEYYTLEERASNHVKLVQAHCLLFSHLSLFEKDENRQYKMMKKRVDMLEAVLKELNPKYYMDFCRELWFELGKTYIDMMKLKSQKMQNSKDATDAQKKVISLSETGIYYFNCFLDSVKNTKTKELPNPLPKELENLILLSHFYLGWIYYKYITFDKAKELEQKKKARDCFKYLTDYCDENEDAKSLLEEEFGLCKEMVPLLQMVLVQL